MAERPNILMIMTDQQRADTIACTGNGHIATPNLDRLCAEGVCFERAYCEMPECVPARAMILTGRWGPQMRVFGNATPLAADAPTFVARLAAAGYRTVGIGKMHFNPPRTPHGFERLLLMEELPRTRQEDEYLRYLESVGYGYVHEPHGVRHELYYIPQPSQLPDRHHGTTWVGDRTVEFIEAAASDSRPFFCLSSFVKPHPPFEPTIPFLTRYDPASLPLPVEGPLDEQDQLPLLVRQTYSKWMESTDANLARTIKAYYYAAVTQIDVQIGRMLDALERTGQRGRTLVLFTTDHGELLGDHGHWGKRSFYEGAARIPLILSWPGHIPAGQRRTQLVGHRDIAPTFLAAAGLADEARNLPGADLLAPAGDASADWRTMTFGLLYESPLAIYAAIDQRFKYVYSVAEGREHLFDLPADPHERRNLARDPAFASHRDRLRAALIGFFEQIDYRWPLMDGDLRRESIPDDVGWARNRQYSRWADPVKPPNLR